MSHGFLLKKTPNKTIYIVYTITNVLKSVKTHLNAYTTMFKIHLQKHYLHLQEL